MLRHVKTGGERSSDAMMNPVWIAILASFGFAAAWAQESPQDDNLPYYLAPGSMSKIAGKAIYTSEIPEAFVKRLVLTQKAEFASAPNRVTGKPLFHYEGDVGHMLIDFSEVNENKSVRLRVASNALENFLLRKWDLMPIRKPAPAKEYKPASSYRLFLSPKKDVLTLRFELMPIVGGYDGLGYLPVYDGGQPLIDKKTKLPVPDLSTGKPFLDKDGKPVLDKDGKAVIDPATCKPMIDPKSYRPLIDPKTGQMVVTSDKTRTNIEYVELIVKIVSQGHYQAMMQSRNCNDAFATGWIDLVEDK